MGMQTKVSVLPDLENASLHLTSVEEIVTSYVTAPVNLQLKKFKFMSTIFLLNLPDG